MSASRRSNSAKTASNAERAAASSVDHALRCSSDPIAMPARSTTRIRADAFDEAARQEIDAAISTPNTAQAHARAIACVDALGYTGIMSVR